MKKYLGYSDVGIKPSSSGLDSRSIPKVRDEVGKLPIWIAPMTPLIDDHNVSLFSKDLHPIISRAVDFEVRCTLSQGYWTAFSFDEASLIATSQDIYNRFDIRLMCIDVPNGHMPRLCTLAKKLRDRYENIYLMSGNIASEKAIGNYMLAGFDYVRLSIGSGSTCTTAIQTGIYVPPITLIQDTFDERKRILDLYQSYKPTKYYRKTKIIADGGIKCFGDISKALVAGADGVMIGGMAARIRECCGEVYTVYGSGSTPSVDRRLMYGMSTKRAQEDYGKTTRVHAEGTEGYVNIEYDLDTFVSKAEQYLKSTCTYLGTHNLNELIGLNQFVELTPSGYMDYKGSKSTY